MSEEQHEHKECACCQGNGECHCHEDKCKCHEHECHCHNHECHSENHDSHECHCHEHECECHEHECHCHDHECGCGCEDEGCDCCDCAPSFFPTILQPMIDVEGSTNPDYFLKPQLVQDPKVWPRGDNLKFKLPPNAFITQIVLKLEGDYIHNCEVTIKNNENEVYKNTYEFPTEGSLECVEYSGPATEFTVVNLKPENPIICSIFVLIGTLTDRCTLEINGDLPYLQPLFVCKTCNFKEGQCVCKACADQCHAGHELEMINSPGYCDCPKLGDCKLKDMKDKFECTYGENGPEEIEQELFRCLTCGYGPKTRMCAGCARICHSGHKIVSCGKAWARCCCGGQAAPGVACKYIPRVEDEINACTFYKYGNKPLEQEMFSCETCNFKEGQKMCLACAMMCHYSHRLIRLGKIEGVCDCGQHKIENSHCSLTADSRPKMMPLCGCPCCMHH
ncbi:Zinc finger in N-recognin family protein [Trichomonas vaginalis G3]|uniref:Zinc finger in N-recognin family protein n=1 Tax=Trichomonas vaginalis (strain ATCC PRA-98 / G3) TaxID=412133 RepID=A2DK29_TRIV3|nr:perineurial glial growth protein family [Trichomonas vaginalis G3]EAY19200.1 Zinc finger in N-recognin family protein [Trichomonas vaginalis G3]KAI5548485.1 perineurial glial growth protein family [Trichomonas vaginalis G3]|eukprot:XP_001580186.1 Zinc finger in N-recognin family protein [Trichomonas vaginalis G3]